MFKVGDIVYCINNKYSMYDKNNDFKLPNLFLDTPYVVKTVLNISIILKDMHYMVYPNTRFISQLDYITMKRNDKIIKLITILNKED